MVRSISLVCGAMLLVSAPVWAQSERKGWLDVNFGVAKAAEKEYTVTHVITISQEAGGGGVGYSLPKGGAFDVGGGYMFSPRVGLGVSLAGTAHEDTAGLAISVPHPLYFNASATDATVTQGTFSRTEGAWHIHAMLVAADTPRLRVRVFAGPSYFRAEQEVVTNIKYDQTYGILTRVNVVDITSYTSAKRDASGWGFHGGGDVSVFFNRAVGVGLALRVSRGTVSLEDYGGEADRKVGGVQFGGGLRFKF